MDSNTINQISIFLAITLVITAIFILKKKFNLSTKALIFYDNYTFDLVDVPQGSEVFDYIAKDKTQRSYHIKQDTIYYYKKKLIPKTYAFYYYKYSEPLRFQPEGFKGSMSSHELGTFMNAYMVRQVSESTNETVSIKKIAIPAAYILGIAIAILAILHLTGFINLQNIINQIIGHKAL